MGKMALFDFVMDFGNSSREQVVPMTVFVAILCLCLVIGHLLEENRWVNESITAIIIGCISGTIILFISKGKSSHILRFNEEVFFIYLLPPIIFNAGFQVKKKQFFHNFLTIMSFGVIGVFISSSIITAGSWWLFPKLNFDGLSVRDYLGIGAIFSSTDTVLQKLDVDRFNGWSAVHIFLDFLYLFSTSTALGVAAGLLTSYILKGLYFGRHSSVREISLMLLMAYLSYMLAELFSLSGILTVFFSGILMSHYAWHNVTDSSRITTRHAFEAMSFIAETFIFLYVGMDALDIEKWKMSKQSVWTSMGIYGTVLILIAVGRAAFVFPLSALSNFMNRNATRAPSISFEHQIVIWWAGLMRGAVSIALAFKQFTYSGVAVDPVHAVMVTTTIIVVLFSTLVFGFLTKPLINYLLPHHDHTRRSIDREPTISKDRLPLLSFEESATTNLLRAKDSLSMLFERPVYTIHSYWRRFDDTYMRPIFGGARRNESSGSG
uniref:Sodium/hydrogen exchanger 4-like isoform X2 n=1 Tax=Nicotiana tabacum TaxID=4097 RepID=A0A1S4A9A3_TOBAC|nr:PREDICTED: sodium/hydrogen exchanger 4-like isoform X2 [Nicotiana tabacum]